MKIGESTDVAPGSPKALRCRFPHCKFSIHYQIVHCRHWTLNDIIAVPCMLGFILIWRRESTLFLASRMMGSKYTSAPTLITHFFLVLVPPIAQSRFCTICYYTTTETSNAPTEVWYRVASRVCSFLGCSNQGFFKESNLWYQKMWKKIPQKSAKLIEFTFD